MHLLDSELIAKLLSSKRAGLISSANIGDGFDGGHSFPLVGRAVIPQPCHAEPKTDCSHGTHEVSVTVILHRAIALAILSVGRGSLAEDSYQ